MADLVSHPSRPTGGMWLSAQMQPTWPAMIQMDNLMCLLGIVESRRL